MRDETRDCLEKLLAARNLILRIIAATNEPQSSDLLVRLAGELETLDLEAIPECLRRFESRGGSYLVPSDGLARLREAHDSQQLAVVARLARALANPKQAMDAKCIDFLRWGLVHGLSHFR